MILADTSIWIDHLRRGDPRLALLLGRAGVVMHECVFGEIALGSLRHRDRTLTELRALPFAVQADNREVQALIERLPLHGLGIGLGIGYVDAHLLASIRLTPGTLLWTRDRRLHAAADRLGIAAPGERSIPRT